MTKVFFNGRQINGRFDSFKAWVRRCVRWFIRWSLISAAGYALFMAGALLYSTSTVSAEMPQIVHVKDVRDFPPALQAICQAESGGKQFRDDKGHVVRGHITPDDIGICQIHEPLWNDKARDLGFDIYTEQGNKDMALWLFDHQGTEPWNSSKAAWLPKLQGK